MTGVQPVVEVRIATACPVRPLHALDLHHAHPDLAEQVRAQWTRPHRGQVDDQGWLGTDAHRSRRRPAPGRRREGRRRTHGRQGPDRRGPAGAVELGGRDGEQPSEVDHVNGRSGGRRRPQGRPRLLDRMQARVGRDQSDLVPERADEGVHGVHGVHGVGAREVDGDPAIRSRQQPGQLPFADQSPRRCNPSSAARPPNSVATSGQTARPSCRDNAVNNQAAASARASTGPSGTSGARPGGPVSHIRPLAAQPSAAGNSGAPPARGVAGAGGSTVATGRPWPASIERNSSSSAPGAGPAGAEGRLPRSPHPARSACPARPTGGVAGDDITAPCAITVPCAAGFPHARSVPAGGDLLPTRRGPHAAGSPPQLPRRDGAGRRVSACRGLYRPPEFRRTGRRRSLPDRSTRSARVPRSCAPRDSPS